MGWTSIFGAENPLAQYAQQNRNTLGALGAGIASGQNFSDGLSAGVQGIPAARQADDAYAVAMKAKADSEAKTQQSMQFLQQHAPQYLDAVQSGVMTAGDAWDRAMKASQPQDPFTLGKGDIRYDGNGNPIAYGTAGGPDTLINNNIGGTDKFYESMDADLGKQQSALIDAGRNAQSNNIRLGQLEQHLASAPQGAQGAFVQFAGQFGIPVDGLDDVQAAQALINQMVPGQRPAGSGTMSDADLALFKQSLPAIMNQPGGNARIIQTTKAINEYTVAQAQIAQQVANREISPAEGRAMQAAIPNPLSNFRAGASFPTTGTGGATDMGNGITIRRVTP